MYKLPKITNQNHKITTEIMKSWNHKWNHRITNEIMKSQGKSWNHKSNHEITNQIMKSRIKSWNHKWNHEITREIMKSKHKIAKSWNQNHKNTKSRCLNHWFFNFYAIFELEFKLFQLRFASLYPSYLKGVRCTSRNRNFLANSIKGIISEIDHMLACSCSFPYMIPWWSGRNGEQK